MLGLLQMRRRRSGCEQRPDIFPQRRTDLEQPVPVPRVVRVGDPGLVEEAAAVKEADRVEVAVDAVGFAVHDPVHDQLARLEVVQAERVTLDQGG